MIGGTGQVDQQGERVVVELVWKELGTDTGREPLPPPPFPPPGGESGASLTGLPGGRCVDTVGSV